MGRRSPIRAWLNDTQRHLTEGSPAALLDLLERKDALTWKERLVGYQALGMLDLPQQERKRAIALLSHVLAPIASEGIWATRLRTAITTAFLYSFALTLAAIIAVLLRGKVPPQYLRPTNWDDFERCPWIVLATIPMGMTPWLTPFCLAGQALKERRRNILLRRAAGTALERISRPKPIVLLAPSSFPVEEPWSQKTVADTHVSPIGVGVAHFATAKETGSEWLPPLLWEGKLRRRSPIRVWLQQRRVGSEEGSAERLLSTLESSRACHWADRAVAYQALGAIELPPATRARTASMVLPALASPAKREALLSRLGNSLLLSGAIGLITAALLLPLYNHLYFLYRHGCCITTFYVLTDIYPAVASLIALFAGPGCFLGLAIRDRRLLDRVQQAAVGALSRVGNPECLVALWDYVRRRTPASKAAIQALREILPMIDADWYGRLPTGSDAALIALAELQDEGLALVALDALEKAGSGDTVVAVERLARSDGSEPVRQRAASILPILLVRRKQEGAASTLLRPSMGVATDHLLKPIYGGASQEAGNLLRASQALAVGPTETP